MQTTTRQWTIGKPWGSKGKVEIEEATDSPGRARLAAVVDQEDAPMVSAAPDLLSSCKDAIGFLESYQMQLNDSGKVVASKFVLASVERMKAAIAKAK